MKELIYHHNKFVFSTVGDELCSHAAVAAKELHMMPEFLMRHYFSRWMEKGPALIVECFSYSKVAEGEYSVMKWQLSQTFDGFRLTADGPDTHFGVEGEPELRESLRALLPQKNPGKSSQG